MTDEQKAALRKVIDGMRARKEDNDANVLEPLLRGGGNGAGSGPPPK